MDAWERDIDFNSLVGAGDPQISNDTTPFDVEFYEYMDSWKTDVDLDAYLGEITSQLAAGETIQRDTSTINIM